MFNFKKLKMPTGEQKEVEAVKTWRVEWISRYGRYSDDVKKEVEIFTDRDLAEEFGEQLREAFKFLRHTSRTDVIVKENK